MEGFLGGYKLVASMELDSEYLEDKNPIAPLFPLPAYCSLPIRTQTMNLVYNKNTV